MPSDERILVCGGGLLGGAIASRLATRHAVRVVDRDVRLASLQVPRVEFRVGDLTSPKWLCSGASDPVPTVCVYAAGALAGAFRTDPLKAGQRALDAFDGFLNFSVSCSPMPHIVLCSSLAVYGMQSRGATEQTPIAPVSHYGRNKAAMESMLARVAEVAGFSYAVLRFCGLVGPVLHPGGGWMQQLLASTISTAGQPPEALAGHEYLHVQDAAQAVELVVRTRGTGVLNVGSGVVPSGAELQAALSGVPSAAESSPGKGMDLTRIRTEFGYRPELDTLPKILDRITGSS